MWCHTCMQILHVLNQQMLQRMLMIHCRCIPLMLYNTPHHPCYEVTSTHTNRLWPPRKSKLWAEKQGIRKRKYLPSVPDCRSNHFKTLPAWGGKSGISLQQLAYCGPWKHTGRCWFTPTKTLWDIEILCIHVSDLGVNSIQQGPCSHNTRGTAQSVGSLGFPTQPKAVNLQRRCPPDVSLTCTGGTISGSVSWDSLGPETPWTRPPQRGMMRG